MLQDSIFDYGFFFLVGNHFMY